MLLVKNNHCNDTMSSEDGVNEATAALKGMLGIGNSSVPQTSKKENTGGKGKKKKKGNKNRSGTPSTRNGGKSSPAREPRKGKKKSEKKQPRKENFAWSAFQALPDASALPLPAFTSPSNSLKSVNETAKNLDSDKLTKLLSAIDHRMPATHNPIDITNAPRAEDLEAKVIAEATKAAKNASQSIQANRKELEAKTITEQEEQNAISDSGINLAALAASPTINRKGKCGMHPHESATGPIPRSQEILTPTAPFSSPNQSFSSPYHSPAHMQQQQQPHAQNPYLQPSMGYITIQVQVPPVLMPDRTMVVTSPAGYPVQIVVPEGVPPGMIIPVHVPTAPLMQSPYGNYAQQSQQQMPYDMHYQYHLQQHELPPQKKS